MDELSDCFGYTVVDEGMVASRNIRRTRGGHGRHTGDAGTLGADVREGPSAVCPVTIRFECQGSRREFCSVEVFTA